MTKEFIDRVLEDFDGRVLVLQNEVNRMDYIIEKAADLGYSIWFNAAPMDEKVFHYPIEKLDWLIINEVEGMGIARCDREEDVLPRLREKYPELSILLTLGSKGAICYHKGEVWKAEAFHRHISDTTAAGDTFIGFFMGSFLRGESLGEALEKATTASAIAISIPGASPSIPSLEEVEKICKEKAFGTLEVKKLS